MTHLVKRTDGFAEAHNAHRYPDGTASLNEVIRDRNVEQDKPADIYFSCDCPGGLQPGDTEVTWEEYDAFHATMTVQNYETKFIPQKEAHVEEIRQKHLKRWLV